MSLEYVFHNDPSRLQLALSQGYDLPTLFLILRDVFAVSQALQLSSEDAAEAFFRLKNIHDISLGLMTDGEIAVYENNERCATRVAAEMRMTGKTVFFRVGKGGWVMCEECGETGVVRRGEVKKHISSSL